MTFSVVIPTCDRPETLAACLQRLGPVPPGCEVIVTDDGTASEARRIVESRAPWAQWTAGPRAGPAANRNHGAGLARQEWLAFLDDDCLPEPGWLAAFATAAQNTPSVPVWEGRTLAMGERNSIDTEAPINLSGGCLWSCNFAIRRAVFAELGGFDPHFTAAAMEDVDLRVRLQERGLEFRFVPEAVVLHPWRRRKGGAFLRAHARSVEHFLNKHPQERREFRVHRQARILAGQIWRNTTASLGNGRVRGLARVVWLDTTTFILLTWNALRRARRRPDAR